jgi:hypothetical protein
VRETLITPTKSRIILGYKRILLGQPLQLRVPDSTLLAMAFLSNLSCRLNLLFHPLSLYGQLTPLIATVTHPDNSDSCR